MIHTAPQSAKFIRLVRLLRPSMQGLPVSVETIAKGILESLWHLTIREARRGDIGRVEDEMIAEACGWLGDPEELIDHLVASRWLDRDETHRLLVHDWHEHAPSFIKKNIAKVGGFLTGEQLPPLNGSEEPVSESETATDSQDAPTPNVTKPNLTQPNEEPVGSREPGPDVGKFMSAWNTTAGVRHAREIKGKRLKALKARWKDTIGGEPWPKAAHTAMRTKFPLRCTLGRDDGWKPDLDWFLRPDTVLQVLEGKYDWSKSEQQPNNGTRTFLEPNVTIPPRAPQ